MLNRGTPIAIPAEASAPERSKWQIIRTDTYMALAGEIVEADVVAGVAKMRERRPDTIDKEGNKTQNWEVVTHTFGPGSIIIIGRR